MVGVDIALLRQIPLFQSVDEADLQSLAVLARLRTYRPREIIVAQGEPARALYVLCRGRVSVSASTGGRTVTIGELGRNEIIGEISLLDGGWPSATIAAMMEVEVVELDRDFVSQSSSSSGHELRWPCCQSSPDASAGSPDGQMRSRCFPRRNGWRNVW